MKTRLTQIAVLFSVSLACALPMQTQACELHQGQSLQSGFGKFHLPPTGSNAEDVARIYGEPLRRLSGLTGLEVWDYGSFRVIMKDNAVNFAGMW